ncbi:MAG: Calx-beta domain-containing protein, partial [Acidimicrobiales bacterium]
FRNAIVTFSVTGPRSGSLRVDYDTIDTGSATADVDFRDFSQTVIISPGQSMVTRAVRIYGDFEPEPTETLEVHLSNPVNATIGDGIGVVTINDNDNYVPPAGPTISVADASVIETDAGTSTANLAVTLSETSATPVTVQLSTTDGTAVDPGDYQAFSGTVTVPANQLSVNQPISIVGDTVFEPTETFTVGLSSAVGAAIADGSATVTITDNDPEPPGVPDLSVSDETVDEGAGTVTVTISADETSTGPVTFDVATSDGSATAGSDYTAVPSTPLTLPANTLSVTQTITILEDGDGEPDETFDVSISNVVGGAIADGVGVVTIDDNDAPACTDGPYITVGDVTVTETEFQLNAIVTFTRSYAQSQSTRFYIETIAETATEGQDYTPRSNQLIVINNGTTKTLAFKVQGDTVAEATETFRVRAYNPTRGCIDPNDDFGTVTIIDNDGAPMPTVSVSDASTTETDGASSVDVTVSLSQTSVDPVTVQLSTTDATASAGSDYVAQGSTTVTIPAGSLTTTAPISIIGDDLYEPTETFTVDLSSPTNATIGDGSATVTILDDEPAPPAVSVSDATTTETDGPSSVDVTVSLDQTSTSPITVLLSTADGTAVATDDYVAINQQLVTIPASTGSVTVPLSIVGDTVYEPTEQFTVTLSSPTNAIIGDGSGTITIDDNEPIPPLVPNITVDDATTTETDGPSTVDVTVRLDQATSNQVTVELATADGTAVAVDDYLATGPTTVTFAPGDIQETVSIGIVGDTISEPAENFTVNLSNAVNGTITDGSGTVTINDNDAPACSDGPLITVQDTSITEGDAFTRNAAVTFNVSYTQPTSTRFYVETVDETATAPADYQPRSGQLVVINANQTSKNLVIKINGDTLDEGNETLRVRTYNPLRGCIDPNDDYGVLTIIDDDGPPVPQISIADATTTETDGPSTVDVTLSLSSAST